MSIANGTVRLKNCRHTILATLRDEIVSGRFPPGTQFPTRVELEKRFAASSVTIHARIEKERPTCGLLPPTEANLLAGATLYREHRAGAVG